MYLPDEKAKEIRNGTLNFDSFPFLLSIQFRDESREEWKEEGTSWLVIIPICQRTRKLQSTHLHRLCLLIPHTISLSLTSSCLCRLSISLLSPPIDSHHPIHLGVGASLITLKCPFPSPPSSYSLPLPSPLSSLSPPSERRYLLRRNRKLWGREWGTHNWFESHKIRRERMKNEEREDRGRMKRLR